MYARKATTEEPQSDTVTSRSATASWILSVRMVSFLTVISRVLGLLRDMAMAAWFGNGPLLDSFTLAFRIPNLSRRLFGEGALTTAFLPEFIQADRKDRIHGEQLATAVLLIMGVSLTVLVLLGELFIWGMQRLQMINLADKSIDHMTAWLLPYVVLICLSAQFVAILQAKRQFAIPAVVPIVLNSCWLAMVWWGIDETLSDTEKIQRVIYAILCGGLLQLLLPWLVLHGQGFRFRSHWRTQSSAVRKVFRTMLPVVIGLSVNQLNAIADSTLAWWYSQPEQGGYVAAGTASALYFGQRMYQFPLGVFGIAIGTVLFSHLVSHVKAGQHDLLARDVKQGLRFVIVIGFPASIGMMILSEPLTEVFLQRGAFDVEDTRQTSQAVFAYATAIWAYLGVSLVQRIYYAIEDTTTPMRVGLITISINLVLNFLLLWIIGGSGLAYATAISAMLQLGLLLLLITSRLQLHERLISVDDLLKILFATVILGLICWTCLQLPFLVDGHWLPGGTLIVPIVISSTAYWILISWLGFDELNELLGWKCHSINISDT